MLGFLHVPRTAGTSLRVSLQQVVPADKIVILEREENCFFLEYEKYASVEVVYGHISWAFADWIGAEKRVTVLREPLARCVSQVAHWLALKDAQFETRDDGGLQLLFARSKGLYWNLEHLLERTDLPQFRALSNAQTAQVANHHIERRNILESSALELAMLHLTQCEVVGVTESIDLFVEKLSLLMNRVVRFEHHENLSWPPNREMTERIPLGVRRKLAQANEMDIELYEKAKTLSRDYFKKNTGCYQIEYLKRDRCNFSLPDMFRPTTFRNVPGSLPVQFFHFLFDIVDLQRRIGACSAGLVDQCADEREIVALKGVFGRERVFANPVTSEVVSEFDDAAHAEPHRGEIERADRLPRLEPGGGPPISLAMVDGGQPLEDAIRAFRFAMRVLDPAGCLCVVNAVAWRSALEISALGAEVGLSAAIVIDRHAILCRREKVWLLHALFRAKFHENFIVRRRTGDVELLQSDTAY
jgi:hypothetical protein